MNKEIFTLLVDDEGGCLDTLVHYLNSNCPRIKVVGMARTADEAIKLVNTLSIDLAFLDIHLFDTNIFDAIPLIDNQQIEKVFVTAYEQYAMQAFRTSALDYLLKPLETREVVRCYGKIERYFDGGRLASSTQEDELIAAKKSSKITLRQGDDLYVIGLEQLLFLKAHGIYTAIHFECEQKIKMVLISKPINMVCKQWDMPTIVRVHRSYAVNVNRVSRIKKHGGNVCIEIAGSSTIPVAKRRAAEFLEHYHK